MVVVLADSNVAFHTQPYNIIPRYIQPLHKHLKPQYLGMVKYGTSHGSGSPVSIVHFSVDGTHNMPTAGHTTGCSSATDALDGYATAIKVLTIHVPFTFERVLIVVR
jgi:hypothetical protein